MPNMTNNIQPFPTRRADRVKVQLSVNINGVRGTSKRALGFW